MAATGSLPFRTTFTPHFGKGNINWFPGHMAKGLRVMHQRLKEIDFIVEVHDARVCGFRGCSRTHTRAPRPYALPRTQLQAAPSPLALHHYPCRPQLPLAGRNLLLQELGRNKPRLLVLNKADLAESAHQDVRTRNDRVHARSRCTNGLALTGVGVRATHGSAGDSALL